MGTRLDVLGAFRLVNLELWSKRSLAVSMARLERSAGTKLAVDFAADADAIAAEVRGRFAKLRPNTTGLCFFLDGAANGRNIDVVACTGYDPADTDLSWVQTARPVGRIASEVLRAAYAAISQNPVEYAVCFGYLGLALRDALHAIGGSPVVRGIALGFRGGDFFLLGELTPKGFDLRVEPAKDEPVAPVVIPKLAVGPKGSTNPRDWLVRAGLLALTTTSGLQGAIGAVLAARDLVAVGAVEDGKALARSAAALARGQRKTSGVSDDMIVRCLAGCVECLGGADEARTLLDDACVLREGLDPFWKKHTANDLTDAARAAGALDVLRRRQVPISKRLPPAKAARPRSRRAILRDVSERLASEDRANAHATFASLLGCGKELHARNDLRSLAKLTSAADEKAVAWKLAKGWVASAALSSLAVLHFLIDDEGGVQHLLGLAERAAAAERTASSKETCALSLRSAFDEVGQADRAFATFRGPKDPFREVASAVRRGALLEVERRIATEKDPYLKSRLLHHVATVLRG